MNAVPGRATPARPVPPAAAVPAPGAGYQALDEYSSYLDTNRPNQPHAYIDFLKKTRYKNGELDNLPRYAIILHASDVPFYLGNLGYAGGSYLPPLDIGSSDPNLMFVVERKSGARFIVNRGLPGAGGITTQTAELGALGVKYVVHIGTCGVLGTVINPGSLLLSNGSYKDGAAVLLSSREEGTVDPIAHPDTALTARLEAVLRAGNADFVRTTGYTSPIFYFQPEGLVKSLFDSGKFRPGPAPAFVEMEQAPFFMAARQMKMSAASLVVGSDRYVYNGADLQHLFPNDDSAAPPDRLRDFNPEKGRQRALQFAIQLFDSMERADTPHAGAPPAGAARPQ